MTVVDVCFEVRCERLPQDYGYSLFRALADRLDWLEKDASAGVHPLHGTAAAADELFLGEKGKDETVEAPGKVRGQRTGNGDVAGN